MTFSELAHAIINKYDRLGWRNPQRRERLLENYQVRSPWILDSDALQDELNKLKALGIDNDALQDGLNKLKALGVKRNG